MQCADHSSRGVLPTVVHLRWGLQKATLHATWAGLAMCVYHLPVVAMPKALHIE